MGETTLIFEEMTDSELNFWLYQFRTELRIWERARELPLAFSPVQMEAVDCFIEKYTAQAAAVASIITSRAEIAA
jgi:hypothetical protein